MFVSTQLVNSSYRSSQGIITIVVSYFNVKNGLVCSFFFPMHRDVMIHSHASFGALFVFGSRDEKTRSG